MTLAQVLIILGVAFVIVDIVIIAVAMRLSGNISQEERARGIE